MNNPVSILYLEDNPRDAELVRNKLSQTPGITCELRVVSDRAAYETALAQTRFDLVLSDFSLPDYDGMAALALAREKLPGIPFILISGTLGDERAVDCMHRGATDVVLKDRLARLVPAVLRALAEADEQQKRREAEAALRASETKYRGLFENSRDAIVILEPPSWEFTSGNPAALAMFGAKSEAEVTSFGPWELSPERQPDGCTSAEKAKEMIATALREGSHFFEWTHRRLGAEEFSASVLLTRMEQAGQVMLQGTIRDITERKRAEAEKAKLEAQFQQAQKMESVARLAGGVAHDFNNMLQAIMCNAELAIEHTPSGSPVRENLVEIQTCARRSAALTRQLLAFARKQVIVPIVLDLNEAVADLLKMLRRLMGENIEMAWLPAANLGPVMMDPSQIDQILANLCVNARDAIHLPAPHSKTPRPAGGVGKVTIETGRAVFDQAYCADHPECVPGEYVRLAVSDDGCGMDKATVAHIFEPFFTTKGVGEGTGLGLATVYGIVKQNHGFIHVYSEPGKGTTFKIYLPRHGGQAAATAPGRAAEPPKGSGETVLLVEDEAAILAVAQRGLVRLGYTVLTASTPGAALRLATAPGREIHLLLTDVVMPEMNGRDLASRLVSHYPKLTCLFMSGYTADVIAQHGVLDQGVHFIEKPFSLAGLAAKVREALGADAKSDP